MKRRGKTLVEMLVVITMIAGLLATSGTVIHRLMRAERAVSSDLVWQRSVTELAEQFRADVHVATKATMIEDGTGLSLALAQGSVTYAVSKRGVGRIWQPAEGVPHTQEYRLEEPGIRFTAQALADRTWAAVSIPRTDTALVKPATTAGTLPQIEIRAAVGRLATPARKDGVS